MSKLILSFKRPVVAFENGIVIITVDQGVGLYAQTLVRTSVFFVLRFLT